jgi:VPDSG-CTERM motif
MPRTGRRCQRMDSRGLIHEIHKNAYGVNTPYHPFGFLAYYFAVNEKNNLRGIAITAAATLLVGLAGNVQAIPITLRDHNVRQTLHSLGQISHNPRQIFSTAALFPALVRSPNGDGHHSVGLANLHNHGHGLPVSAPVTDQGAYPIIPLHTPVILPVSLPKPPVLVVNGGGTPGHNVVSVPDGGTTAAMMAVSFCGLALLRKKLKA